MTLTEATAKRILELSKNHNYSLNDLAFYSNVPLSTIKNMIYNKTNNPSSAVILKICQVFNMELKDFYNSDYFKNIK